MRKCYLCGCGEHKKREGSVRDDPSIGILECSGCGLVFLDTHKTSRKFYEQGAMHDRALTNFIENSKDPITSANFITTTERSSSDSSGGGHFEAYAQDRDSLRRFGFFKEMIRNKDVLDFGSGYGGFLSLAKQVAKSVCGIEIEQAVQEVYDRLGIRLYRDICEVSEKVDVISCFHCLEHLDDPRTTLRQFAKKLGKNGKIIIEVPNANDDLLSIYKSEAFSHFTYWSAHLYLFSASTLALLARQAGLKVEFIKYIQRYPLSNHLYWLSHARPAGDKVWGEFLDNALLNSVYGDCLASIGVSDTLLGLFSLQDDDS